MILEFPPGRHFRRWADPPAAQQVRGQAVDRLQHGQPPQEGLHAAGGGGPGRVLVVSAVAAGASRLADGEGGIALDFQINHKVGRMVVVQGEPLTVRLGQFPLRVKCGQPGGPGLLPGCGMPVVGDVEQVHGPAGQKPAVLPPLGHAPHHRGNPAATAQCAQHSPYFPLFQTQRRGQVGRAGQGHPGGNFQQPSLFVGEWFPSRHRCVSYFPVPSRVACAGQPHRPTSGIPSSGVMEAPAGSALLLGRTRKDVINILNT